MRVLVLKEKHGEAYYAVPADKEGHVMLHVIRERCTTHQKNTALTEAFRV